MPRIESERDQPQRSEGGEQGVDPRFQSRCAQVVGVDFPPAATIVCDFALAETRAEVGTIGLEESNVSSGVSAIGECEVRGVCAVRVVGEMPLDALCILHVPRVKVAFRGPI